MKKWGKQLLALTVCVLLLATTAFAATIPDPPKRSCVLDESNVLSESTEKYVNDRTIELDKACGAQIAVLTVDFTGSSTTADYAYDVFNEWGVGDAKKNNGALLLLVIGEEDYYCALGTGLEKKLSASMLDDLLYSELEPGFAEGNYDRGVRDFVDALSDEIAMIYNVESGYGPHESGYRNERENDVMGNLLTVIVLLIITFAIIGGGTYVRGRGNGFLLPFLLGRWSKGSRSNYYTGRSSSNYSHRSSSSYRSGSRSSSSRSSFGGFGGGSSRGAGAGRSSSGGSRSGGAGRRR